MKSSEETQIITHLFQEIFFGIKIKMNTIKKRDGLTCPPIQGKVLLLIYKFKSISQKEICYYSGRDKTQITRIIQKLAKNKLIDKKVSKLDRRYINLSLSKKGMELAKSIKQCQLESAKELCRGIESSEVKELKSLLKKVKANLTN